jgi:phytoene dehydrogenase-like protein
MDTLGIDLQLRTRTVSSYTPSSAPDGNGHGLLVSDGREPSDAWQAFHAMVAGVARRVFPTLTEPLRSRAELSSLVSDDAAWEALFERPLADVLERSFDSDIVRGIVLTDGAIGTFARHDDPELRQNRCFLYHVIGNGTGRWDVPVGGMGALTAALRECAGRAGVEIRTGAEVVSIATDGTKAEVACADGSQIEALHVLANVAPRVLARLLAEDDAPPGDRAPEGSQLKINMLLKRLPRLRDPDVGPQQAFAGTFHVNESYTQLRRAYDQAAGGQIPTLPPCELYCHSLTDPSILSSELRAAGAQTLTLFGLHMPARLFADERTHGETKAAALAATLRSLNSVLAEPVEDCLWTAPDGTPCVETLTPADLEAELGLPGGHIFHRDLTWPFAENEQEIGTWGVETAHANVWICGAGARRGGGVSGIPGHNAAQAVLATRTSR